MLHSHSRGRIERGVQLQKICQNFDASLEYLVKATGELDPQKLFLVQMKRHKRVDHKNKDGRKGARISQVSLSSGVVEELCSKNTAAPGNDYNCSKFLLESTA